MTANDFALARKLMVDGQLRPSKVNDKRVLDAMRTLPRERFVPRDCAELAYIDADVKLAGPAIMGARVLMKPLVQARLIQLAAPRAGEAALIVGSGTGYAAAVLAFCGVRVIALEEDEALAAIARAALADLPEGSAPVTQVAGKLAKGWAASAPYDLVLIEGAVRTIPDAIAQQVSAHGRLVTVLWPEDAASYAALAEPSTGGLRAVAAFDASTALLPSLIPAKSFTF